MKRLPVALAALAIVGCQSNPSPTASRNPDGEQAANPASQDKKVAHTRAPFTTATQSIQQQATPTPAPTAQQALVAAQKEGTTIFQAVAMTVPYKIIIGKDLNRATKSTAEAIINDTFDEVDRIYNKWNPDSEISRLNKLPANVETAISLQMEKFLLETEQIVELTEGRFDPTVLPLYDLWRTAMEKGQRPNKHEVEDMAEATGWKQIHFGNGKFRKDHDLTALDLGGIAKGHCIDKIVERLTMAGFKDVYVEWGGEIRTAGQHPSQRPWRVSVSCLGDPDPDNAVAILNMRDQALATSGDYHQSWRIPSEQVGAGVDTYFHIINPTTGEPMKIAPRSVASVSVLAPNCMLADGLATAAMMFETPAEAQAWAKGMQRRLQGTAFWILNREMTAHQDIAQQ